jgi:hypothetical protein
VCHLVADSKVSGKYSASIFRVQINAVRISSAYEDSMPGRWSMRNMVLMETAGAAET